MPVNFLSKAKQELYGRYAQPPTESQLSRYFHLDDVDRHYIGQRRYAHNRLGFALQVTTVRFLGTFLEDPIDVPVNTIAYLAHQLGMTSIPNLIPYRENKDPAC